MSLFTKISGWLSGGTAVEKGIADAIGHFLHWATPKAVSRQLFTLVELESESHPTVVAEMQKLQTALANVGLANPVVVAAPAAPVTPAVPVTPPAPPVAPASVQPAVAAVQPANVPKN